MMTLVMSAQRDVMFWSESLDEAIQETNYAETESYYNVNTTLQNQCISKKNKKRIYHSNVKSTEDTILYATLKIQKKC